MNGSDSFTTGDDVSEAERLFLRRDFAAASLALRRASERLANHPGATGAVDSVSGAHGKQDPTRRELNREGNSAPLTKSGEVVDALDGLRHMGCRLERKDRPSTESESEADDGSSKTEMKDGNGNADPPNCVCVAVGGLWLQLLAEARAQGWAVVRAGSAGDKAGGESRDGKFSLADVTRASLFWGPAGDPVRSMPIPVVRIAATRLALSEQFRDADKLLSHFFLNCSRELTLLATGSDLATANDPRAPSPRELEAMVQLQCLYVLPALGRFAEALRFLDDDPGVGHVAGLALPEIRRTALRQRVLEVQRAALLAGGSGKAPALSTGNYLNKGNTTRIPSTPVSSQVMAAARSGFVPSKMPTVATDDKSESSTNSTQGDERPAAQSPRAAEDASLGSPNSVTGFVEWLRRAAATIASGARADPRRAYVAAIVFGIFIGLLSIRRRRRRSQLLLQGNGGARYSRLNQQRMQRVGAANAGGGGGFWALIRGLFSFGT